MDSNKVIKTGVISGVALLAFSIVVCRNVNTWLQSIIDAGFWRPAGDTMVLTIISGFLSGFIFATLYAVLYDGIPGFGTMKGVIFGVLMWIIGSLLPNWWSYILTTNPEVFLIVDSARGLARYIFLGIVCGIVYKDQ
jgi:hypothetical protein